MQVTKRDRAIALCDLALPLVKARGVWEEVGGGPKFLTLKADGLTISYRSPFQKLAPFSGDTLRKALAYGLAPKANLPHGLNVWHASTGKVLNVEWSDQGEVAVVSYKVGPWEKVIEALAA